MDNEQVLKIVLKAQDDASAAFRKAAEEVDKLQKTIKDGTDNASDSLEKAGKSASYFKDHIQDIGIAAGGILGSIGAMTKSMVDVAATMEQNRIAFTTMTGSAELAGKTLKQLSDFAATTPFELPQLVEGSKKLLAYNIEAKNIIPTMKMLGDISAGVGMDKLPNLILAFGQVKAATHLTGMELRQFSEAGVPLLDALVKQANAAGGAWVTVGGSAKKSKVDVAEVTEKIGILNQKMAENQEKYKEGSVAYRQAQLQLKGFNDQLAAAGNTSEGTRQVWQKTTVTANDMIEKISKGEVTFDQVQKALGGMTKEGGKFFNLMDKQSHSFSGIMSNMKDNLTRLSMQLVGMTESGEIRQGSLFFYIKEGAQKLLVVMDDLRPKLVRLADDLLHNKTVVIGVAGALGGLAVAAITAAVAFAGPAIAGALAFAAAGTLIAGAIQGISEHLQEMMPHLVLLSASLTVLSFTNPFSAIIVSAGLLAGGVSYLATQTDIFKTKQDLINEAHKRAKDAIDAHWQAVQTLNDKLKELNNDSLNLEGAQLRYERAQRTLSDTTKTFGTNSLEAREARHQLKEAEQSVHDIMDKTNTDMAKAQQLHDDAVKKSKDVVKSHDEETEAVKRQATAWDNVINGIKSAIDLLKQWDDKIKKTTGGIGLTVPGYKLPGFDQGGYVPKTGIALVHEGEFVMSKDMLAGRQNVPSQMTTTNNNQPINIYANVSSDIDMNVLGYKLAFAVRNSR